MHRDFFVDEDGFAIPSRSLDDVFLELEKSHNTQLKWLTVNANSMNVDHDPKTVFEKNAATALASGKDFFEATTAKNYQFAGAIGLKSQCLKYHLQRRTDNKPRTSGLMISIPIERTQERSSAIGMRFCARLTDHAVSSASLGFVKLRVRASNEIFRGFGCVWVQARNTKADRDREWSGSGREGSTADHLSVPFRNLQRRLASG